MVVFAVHPVCPVCLVCHTHQVCLVLLPASEAVAFPVLQQVSVAVVCLAWQPASEAEVYQALQPAYLVSAEVW